MAKRGGFPGGAMPGNMSNLMKQAQRMQRQMEEGQKELETKEFSASAGGSHPLSWPRRSWIPRISRHYRMQLWQQPTRHCVKLMKLTQNSWVK